MNRISPGEIGPTSELAALRIPAAEMTGFFRKGEHAFRGVPRLRGLGAPVTKSAALLSVSMHPFERRRMAVKLSSNGAGALSAALAAPYPTKSITWVPTGLLPD